MHDSHAPQNRQTENRQTENHQTGKGEIGKGETAHHKIDYVEFASATPQKSCDFFAAVFGWTFESFGPDYVAFHGAGLEGGFYRADLQSRAGDGGALIVFYSTDLEASERLVRRHGGQISKPVFAFPGGRRFHFTEPCGNELAIWSDR